MPHQARLAFVMCGTLLALMCWLLSSRWTSWRAGVWLPLLTDMTLHPADPEQLSYTCLSLS